jgi:hypothetical protein
MHGKRGYAVNNKDLREACGRLRQEAIRLMSSLDSLVRCDTHILTEQTDEDIFHSNDFLREFERELSEALQSVEHLRTAHFNLTHVAPLRREGASNERA